jgi:uncharacterized protein YndB with AHSA1/START domain
VTAEPVRAQIRIDAPPERVWEFFTLPEAIIRWMGEYAVLAPRPGGEFTVNVKGAPVRGRYLELDPPHRLLLSWGYAGSAELPPARAPSRSASSPTGPAPACTRSTGTCQTPNNPATLKAGSTTSPAWPLQAPATWPRPDMQPVSSPQGGGRIS